MVQDRYEGVRPNDPKTRCSPSTLYGFVNKQRPAKKNPRRKTSGRLHMMLTIPPSLLAELDAFRDSPRRPHVECS
jgi:hypothetical protein